MKSRDHGLLVTTKFYPNNEAEQACLLEWLNTNAWRESFITWQMDTLERLEKAREFTAEDQVRAHAMGVQL